MNWLLMVSVPSSKVLLKIKMGAMMRRNRIKSCMDKPTIRG